jgi:predicted RNA methylase
MAATKKITTDVLDVLASMEVEGSVARITEGVLDRKLYVNVNKALEAIGGKWSRSARGHVFDGDPSDALDEVVLTGEYTDKKQAFQFFETPEALADELVAAADIRDGMRVLEPSAGRGRIVRAIKKVAPDCTLFAIEIQPELCEHIHTQHLNINLFCNDFMQKAVADVDRVVMNPPFSRHQDTDHVTRAFSMLKPGGRLVSVVSGSATHRIDKKGVAFAALVKQHGSYYDLPEGTFKESGTMVRAGVVVLDKE